MWSIYIDDLLLELERSNCGCFRNGKWCGAFLYADDICLLSPTSAGLVKLISITESYCAKHQIKLNPLKSCLLVCGCRKRRSSDMVNVCCSAVAVTRSVKYLGFELLVNKRGGLFAAANIALKRFFYAANSIFAMPGCRRPFLRLELIKALVLPHSDRMLTLWRFLNKTSRRAVNSAVCCVLRRCLGLHTRCNTDIVHLAACVVRTTVRAGQVMVLGSDAVDQCLAVDTADVYRRRLNGACAKAAAICVFVGNVSVINLERARCITSLLYMPDCFSRAMARHISIPSVLLAAN